MHTDASNIQANCFIVRGIIPELTGLGVHPWNRLRQAGATLLGSVCIFIIGIGYGFAVVGSEAKFAAEANLAFHPIMISMCDATNASQRRFASKYSRVVGFGIDGSLFDANQVPLAANKFDVKGHKSTAAEGGSPPGPSPTLGTMPRGRAPNAVAP